MPTTHRQFREVALGIVLVWIDIRIGGFDILPDLLGYALMALGLITLARRHVAFAIAAVFAVVLGLDELYALIVAPFTPSFVVGIGGLPLSDTELLRFNWSWRTVIGWVLEYGYNIVLTIGLGRFLMVRGDLADGETATQLRSKLVYTALFTLVAGISALALPTLATVLLMPPLVCQITFTSALVSLLWRAARPPSPDALLAQLLAPESPPQRHPFDFWLSLSPTARAIIGGALLAYVLAVWWYMVPCSRLDIVIGKSGCAALIEQPRGAGAGMAFTADNRFIVTNGGGQVRQVNIASGRVASAWGDDNYSYLSGVALSPDGTTVVAAQSNGIIVWRAGEQLADIRIDGGREDEGTRVVAFAPDGASVAAADGKGTVYIWRTVDGTELHRLRGLDIAPIALQFSAHGTIVAASQRRIAEWRVDDGVNVQTLDLPQFARALAIDNEGSTYAIVNNDAWEQRSVTTGEVVRRFSIANGDLDARLAFSPNGALLAIWGSQEGSPIIVYQVADGRRAAMLRVPEQNPYADRQLRFSPDSRMLAASGFYVWNFNDNVAVWRVP